MENSSNKTIKSYRDLRIYQNLYKAMVLVLKDIAVSLPKEERYDLADQLRRACKAGPALIAEGFAKRYQKKNWQKYINDTIGECNEMIHHLSVCIDIYPRFVKKELCEELINIYDLSCRQLYSLSKTWKNFHETHDK